jgi:prophage regulatory protein
MDIIDPSTTLIRTPEVLRMIGYKSRDSLDRLRKADKTFPLPVQISNSTARNASIAWTLSEVRGWIETRKNMRHAAA